MQTHLEGNIANKINNGINEIIYGNPSKEEYKVIVLGDSGIGAKSSLIIRIVNDEFDPHMMSTNGGSHAPKELYLKNDIIKLHIWDTAGQKKYIPVTKFLINGSDCIILGYDVTRSDSFDSIKSSWYKISKENSETDLIYLVGNKIDLIDNRQVQKEEALQYCEKNILKFLTRLLQV